MITTADSGQSVTLAAWEVRSLRKHLAVATDYDHSSADERLNALLLLAGYLTGCLNDPSDRSA